MTSIKPRMAFIVDPSKAKAFADRAKDPNVITLTKYLEKAKKDLEEIAKKCNTTRR